MDKPKSEKVVILGKSGSGKDFLMRKLVGKGLIPGLKWTTRPQRKLEKQGVSYNFVSDSEFFQAIKENKFLTYQKFEVEPEGSDPVTWYYGITLEEFEKSQVFIMTPGEFLDINPEQRKRCFVVYLDIDRPIRESRLHIREDKNDSIRRRLDADDIDFEYFKDYDLKVTDPEFNADDVYGLME
jgi:guanylate kinase